MAYLAIDAHVHLYECFNLCHLFDAAYQNLTDQAPATAHGARSSRVLLLTETPRESGFDKLSAACRNPEQPFCSGTEDWFCHPTDEDCSFKLQSTSGKTLFLIAGRQVVVREGLEVHVLATGIPYSEGAPLSELLAAVRDNGDVAALPWGAGKWLGRRGRIIATRINAFKTDHVLLSDSGIRPRFWPRPRVFDTGTGIIAGTDPLPLPAEAGRVGSYGFSVQAEWDERTPAASVRRVLRDDTLTRELFGASQGLWQFAARQFAIRI